LEEKRAQEAARQQEESKTREEVPGLQYQAPVRANIDIEDNDL